MADTRMKKSPEYKKILVRVPLDILAALADASSVDDRSLNGELVHVLRQWMMQRAPASVRQRTHD